MVKSKLIQSTEGFKRLGRERPIEERLKISETMRKNGHISIHGYRVIRIRSDDNLKTITRFEHRVNFEKYHKCCVLPWIDIHHINGDKLDNRIENLKPVLHTAHTSNHKKGCKFPNRKRKNNEKKIHG